jgi:hypothetical protein
MRHQLSLSSAKRQPRIERYLVPCNRVVKRGPAHFFERFRGLRNERRGTTLAGDIIEERV